MSYPNMGLNAIPKKINAIKNWPRPENVSEVRSLLGITSYYRKHICSFSELAFLLTQLTRKNQKFHWTEDCEAAFIKLRQALVSSPILAYPTREDPFILDTDASMFGIGAVLFQKQMARNA